MDTYLQCFFVDPNVYLAPEATFGATMFARIPLVKQKATATKSAKATLTCRVANGDFECMPPSYRRKVAYAKSAEVDMPALSIPGAKLIPIPSQ